MDSRVVKGKGCSGGNTEHFGSVIVCCGISWEGNTEGSDVALRPWYSGGGGGRKDD